MESMESMENEVRQLAARLESCGHAENWEEIENALSCALRVAREKRAAIDAARREAIKAAKSLIDNPLFEGVAEDILARLQMTREEIETYAVTKHSRHSSGNANKKFRVELVQARTGRRLCQHLRPNNLEMARMLASAGIIEEETAAAARAVGVDLTKITEERFERKLTSLTEEEWLLTIDRI